MVPCKVKPPVRVLIELTPAVPPPPPLVRHVGQVKLPAASSLRGPLAETATVPLALGMVTVLLLLDGVAKTSALVTPPDVALSVVPPSPCKVKVWLEVPTVNVAVGVIVLTPSVPPIVTVEPLSVIMESPIELPEVNLATLLVVPPTVVTPPPTPAQLPILVQIV